MKKPKPRKRRRRVISVQELRRVRDVDQMSRRVMALALTAGIGSR